MLKYRKNKVKQKAKRCKMLEILLGRSFSKTILQYQNKISVTIKLYLLSLYPVVTPQIPMVLCYHPLKPACQTKTAFIATESERRKVSLEVTTRPMHYNVRKSNKAF